MTANRIDIPIYCQHCRLEIESCEGIWGDWMHVKSRKERCLYTRWPCTAEPEVPGETRQERDRRAAVNAANRGKKRGH